MSDNPPSDWAEVFAANRPWTEDLDMLFYAMVHARLRAADVEGDAVYGLNDPDEVAAVYALALRAARPVARWRHRRTVDRWNRATDGLYRSIFWRWVDGVA